MAKNILRDNDDEKDEKKSKKGKKAKDKKKKKKKSTSSSSTSSSTKSDSEDLAHEEMCDQLALQLSIKPKMLKLKQFVRMDDLSGEPRFN